MSVECSQCGAESTLAETYAVETSALGRKRRYCPPCVLQRNERRARAGLSWLVLLAVVALIGLALGRATVGEAGGWFVLNLFLLVLFLEIATLPHELGHAIAAHWLGFRVFAIAAGVGPRIFERNVKGVRIRLHAYPFGGFTLAAPREPRWFRTKQSLLTAAGPAVNAVLAACALLLARDFELESILSEPRPALALLAANGLLLTLNLLPMKATSAAGVVPNDGLALVKMPFLPEQAVTEALVARYVLEADARREADSPQEACAWAERGLAEFPGTPLLHLSLGFNLVLVGDCEGARREFLAAAETKDAPPALRALALNNAAWVDVVTAPNGRLEEADRLSREALETLGFVRALKGTRGAVLVEMDRSDEGVVLLQDALRERRDDALHPMARASYAGALVLGLVKLGRVEEAGELLPAARGYGGRCPLLGRVEAAMAEASGRTTAEIPDRAAPGIH